MSTAKRLGKYELIEMIGRGGMGVVYKATDPEIGRTVSIKLMTKAVVNQTDLLKRFYREAQSAGKLQHPNIVTIYDLGVQEATPYIVMEFLEGESLASMISSRRALALEEKLRIVIQTCEGLSYAHERSIVHRDIKPANLMVLKDGTVKIVDFGIARIEGENVTRTGQVMGSIQYMSPEQINGARVDSRTDIFSTGVVLYQLLTYVLPFQGKDSGEMVLKVIHGAPTPLCQFLKAYPPQLDGIVERALAKNPDERYQSAADLAFELSQIQEQLKHETASQYLQAAEHCFADGQWSRAKELLLQVGKIDRQNTRVNVLLREVQQRIQKQQFADQVRDLRTKAEQAEASNALDEAVRYLDMAAALDESDLQVRELRDSLRKKKQRAEKLNELLQRAETAREEGDLDEGLAATEEALAIDGDNTDAKALHALIEQLLGERTRLKQVHSFVEEARNQILSGRFIAALGILEKAEKLDPGAQVIRELMTTASAGQRQQQLREEKEQLVNDVEEALNRDDFLAACAKVDEGIQKFPDDVRLLKLKELANRGRAAREGRLHPESRMPLVRCSAEGEVAIPQREGLEKHPKGWGSRSVLSLVMEQIRRKRADLFTAKSTQRARKAIGQKAYSEAIEILQAARRKGSSSELDSLLQFAQQQAANRARRQKIDAASERARSLISADEYGQAIEMLEAILLEVDDEGLHIILLDARRHVEELSNSLQEVIAKANRSLRLQRYSEAVQFLESCAGSYRKLPEFWQALQQMRHEKLRVEAFSAAKEQVRNELDNCDFNAARATLAEYCKRFGEGLDARLMEQEIETREELAAKTSVERALTDCRVLLLVRCYQSVLDILDKVSSAVALVPPEVRMEYEVAWETARVGVERNRADNLLRDDKTRPVEPAMQPTISQAEQAVAESFGAEKNVEQETQVASLTRLEEILRGVTQVAEHYPEDGRVQALVGGLKKQLTLQLAASRPSDSFAEKGGRTEPKAPVEDGAAPTRRETETPASPEVAEENMP
jgi:eukaryotic-like serine/threonine-protein kinase